MKLLLVAALGGCATQNAHTAYFEAEAMLKRAMTKVGTNDPKTTASFDALAKGKLEMMDARYDSALKYFRESMKLSREVNEGKTALSSVEPQVPAKVKLPESPPVVTPAPVEVVQAQPSPTPTPKAEVKAKPREPVDSEVKKSLPKKALAKYLAAKKTSAKLSSPKPSPKTEPDLGKKAEAESLPTEVIADEPDIKKETLDADAVVVNTVVIAPASPSMKQAPKPAVEEAAREAAAPKGSEAKEKGPAKLDMSGRQRIPESVPFILNDPSIITEAVSTLNQTAKYLLENPSTTLMLQGYLAGQEAGKLFDERYESIKSYLVGKGVPEDQIQLDENRKRGKNSEFKMSLIDH